MAVEFDAVRDAETLRCVKERAGPLWPPRLTSMSSVAVLDDEFSDRDLATLVEAEPHLDSLDIISSRLSSKGICELPKLSDLRVLALRVDSLTEEDLRCISEIPGLTNLRLSTNVIDGKGFAHLRKAESLDSLLIASHDISDADVKLFPKLPIAFFSIQSQNVTKRSVPEILKVFSSLDTVSFSHTAITDDELSEIALEHPGLIWYLLDSSLPPEPPETEMSR